MVLQAYRALTIVAAARFGQGEEPVQIVDPHRHAVCLGLGGDAPVASAGNIELNSCHQPITQIGRFSYNPVDINSAYVNGHLYYPTRLHSRVLNDENKVVERLETWVIRSDKTKHRAYYMEAPPGTPLVDRVLKLTDGTVIKKEPMASTHGTWAFESINAWLNGKNHTRPLKDVVNDITSWLRKTAWLPYDEDFTVLALTVVVTYVQRVFESVPLIMLNGPRGTGKTQVGIAMTAMCNNGMMIGQGSAASCLLYTSPSPRDRTRSRMPSSA